MAVVEEREGWLAGRAKGIGGTDIGSILGLSPWTTPLDVFLGKTGQAAGARPVTQAMKWGNRLEGLIFNAFKEDTQADHLVRGTAIADAFPGRATTWGEEEDAQDNPQHTLIRHRTLPYLLGTPDGYDPARQRGLEIKNSGYKNPEWGDQNTDQVPQHYLAQCAWYMAVTDTPVWDVAVLFSGTRLETFKVVRELALEKIFIDAGMQFWDDHVLRGVPPKIDATESWTRYLGRRFAVEVNPPVKATPEMCDWAALLHSAGIAFDKAEESERMAKNHLMELIGDAKGAWGNFGKLTWVRPRAQKVIDYEAAFNSLWAFASDHALFKPEDDSPQEFLTQYTSERAKSPYLLATFKRGAFE